MVGEKINERFGLIRWVRPSVPAIMKKIAVDIAHLALVSIPINKMM